MSQLYLIRQAIVDSTEMKSWADSPLLNAVLSLGWILLACGATYRHHREKLSRARTIFIVASASGWVGFSANEALVLVGAPDYMGDITLLIGTAVFFIGVGYSAYTFSAE